MYLNMTNDGPLRSQVAPIAELYIGDDMMLDGGADPTSVSNPDATPIAMDGSLQTIASGASKAVLVTSGTLTQQRKLLIFLLAIALFWWLSSR